MQDEINPTIELYNQALNGNTTAMTIYLNRHAPETWSGLNDIALALLLEEKIIRIIASKSETTQRPGQHCKSIIL